MTDKLINVEAFNTPIVDANGAPTAAFFNFLEAVSQLEITDGDIEPNGNLKARPKAIYWQRGADRLWFKTTGPNINTGWIPLN